MCKPNLRSHPYLSSTTKTTKSKQLMQALTPMSTRGSENDIEKHPVIQAQDPMHSMDQFNRLLCFNNLIGITLSTSDVNPFVLSVERIIGFTTAAEQTIKQRNFLNKIDHQTNYAYLH